MALATHARSTRVHHRQRDWRCREHLEELRQPHLWLALLAPDIIETVLEGRPDQALMLEQLERPLPMSWEEQRRLISATMRSRWFEH
jgi:hypothetical protein